MRGRIGISRKIGKLNIIKIRIFQIYNIVVNKNC